MPVLPTRPVVLCLTLWSVTTALAVAQFTPAPATAARNRAFVNGRVFDGQHLVAGTLYVTADGLFSRSRPPDAEVVDLAGGYVVPPFGEAHNHNVDSEAAIDRYLRTGIFYVSNPNTHPGGHSKLPRRLNSPTGVDVLLAGGGLTASGGHPFFVVQRNIDRKMWTEADGDGAFYHAIDSADDLEKKWPAIVAGRPDFVKIYLLYSEEFARRRDDRATIGWRGLDPALVPLIVQRARASGLRVAAHVETAADFRAAVRGGVDVVAHLPGFRPPLTVPPFYPNLDAHRLTAADAEEAAQRRVTVVTTVSSLLEAAERGLRGFTPSDSEAFRALIRSNLSVLKAAGVSIALGSDRYDVTSEAEVRRIAALGLFSPLDLLQMWSMVTPTMIFPTRKIARLEPGYEASFLVLDGDPTTSVDHLSRIVTRVKQGVVLPGALVAPRATGARVPVTVTQSDLVPLCVDGAAVAADQRSWGLEQREHVLAFTMQNRPRMGQVPEGTPGIAVVRFTPESDHEYEVEIRTTSPMSYSTRIWQRGEWRPVVRDRTMDRIVSGDPEWVASCRSG